MENLPLKESCFYTEKALTRIPKLDFPHLGSGKVRELYDLGDKMLILTTDRVSAFNYLFKQGIPGKGIVLTRFSNFWFNKTRAIISNHLLRDQEGLINLYLKNYPELKQRAMIVAKCKPLPIEAVVRGYLDGSGWKSYCETGKLFGQALPSGLKKYGKLPEPFFTPTAKSAKDEPLSDEEAKSLLTAPLFSKVKDYSLALYGLASRVLAEHEFMLADTKLEFGVDLDGKLMLIDEAFTPDSSRFWRIKDYEEGIPTPFDKQIIRNYLETSGWDKVSEPGDLPEAIIEQTSEQYQKLLKILF